MSMIIVVIMIIVRTASAKRDIPKEKRKSVGDVWEAYFVYTRDKLPPNPLHLSDAAPKMGFWKGPPQLYGAWEGEP